MKLKHRDGEDAAGSLVSVTTHLKPEVDENGFFEVEEDRLTELGVDPEAARERLQEAGHTPAEDVTEEDDSEEAGADETGSESSDSEGQDEEAGAEDEGGEEPATKTELMDLKKDQLVTIGESFDDVDTDQNKEPLAEDLADAGVVLQEEGGE